MSGAYLVIRSTVLYIAGFLDYARNDKKNILTRFNGLETSRTRREKKAGRLLRPALFIKFVKVMPKGLETSKTRLAKAKR